MIYKDTDTSIQIFVLMKVLKLLFGAFSFLAIHVLVSTILTGDKVYAWEMVVLITSIVVDIFLPKKI